MRGVAPEVKLFDLTASRDWKVVIGGGRVMVSWHLDVPLGFITAALT